VLKGRAEGTGCGLEEITAEALNVQSLKRFVDPDDIGALCLFLASDSAKSITGQTFSIECGARATE
jgi:enoyl-[acyl-carrier-protein] reductase (NADH)